MTGIERTMWPRARIERGGLVDMLLETMDLDTHQ